MTLHNEPSETETQDGLLVTGFTTADTAFGIDAKRVLEVVKVGEITPVYGAPSGVSGIRNLRGRIVTVVDMAEHLELGGYANSPEARLLIMEHDGEHFGFLVDTVTEAMVLDTDDIGAPPAGIDPRLRSRLLGVWRQGDRLTAILDTEALFKWNDA